MANIQDPLDAYMRALVAERLGVDTRLAAVRTPAGSGNHTRPAGQGAPFGDEGAGAPCVSEWR